MKKLFALLASILAGGYLIFLGWVPDALPFIDEATALLILVKSLQVLGFDISRFIPFMKSSKKATKKPEDGPVVDV